MTVSDAAFEQVELNSRERSACSPAEPRLPWHGIVVQAPTQVGFKSGQPVADGTFAAIPICGFYRVDLGKLIGGTPMMLVVTNLQDHTQYRGAVLDEDPGHMEPNPNRRPIDPAKLEGMSTGSYFNPNLAKKVALPEVEATYEVHAEYGGAVSNSVRISVVRRR